MRRVGWVSLLALASAHAQVLSAQVTTNIVPDVALDRSLGTSATALGSMTTIDGGTLTGTNLFHSFSVFDLGSGDTARWVHGGGDANGISNVINRVTGGTSSSIFGTLDSTALPNADFFFIIPAGIIFGEGAQVNVPAAVLSSRRPPVVIVDPPVC